MKMTLTQTSRKRWVAIAVVGVAMGWSGSGHAGDLKITLPKRSQATAVQRLNREGVEAVRKHSYAKAEGLFYKAYLLDPDDPFTLNNLGYIAELQGQVDRAQRFYALAAQQPTDAVIDFASTDFANNDLAGPHRAMGRSDVGGRSVNDALTIPNASLGVNHDNVEAVRMLSQGRAPEVDLLLQQTLKNDPHNIFTLNNMGVAKEMEGESQEALRYYDAAAAVQSKATAIVTVDRSWRGKQVVEMATRNAQKLRKRLAGQQSVEVQTAELNLRGVSAFNRNDLSAANQDFQGAYVLNPNNAFALNNIGYMAEIEGDRDGSVFL
jgi:tetratricopeptide (TPR) repeat protein